MTAKEAYKKAYKSYLKAVERIEKRFGVTLKKRGMVQVPRKRAIESLGREREKLARIRHELEVEQRAEKAYEVKWEEVRKLVDDAEVFEWSPAYSKSRKDRSMDPSGSAMVSRNGSMMYDILDRAEVAKPKASDRIKALESKYGGIEKVLAILTKLLYAVYNSGNSGFAQWAGANAATTWKEAWKDFEAVLLS